MMWLWISVCVASLSEGIVEFKSWTLKLEINWSINECHRGSFRDMKKINKIYNYSGCTHSPLLLDSAVSSCHNAEERRNMVLWKVIQQGAQPVLEPHHNNWIANWVIWEVNTIKYNLQHSWYHLRVKCLLMSLQRERERDSGRRWKHFYFTKQWNKVSIFLFGRWTYDTFKLMSKKMKVQ